MADSPRPILQFHPEPYGSGGSRPMGRHAAGSGFLRAFVEGRRGAVAAMGMPGATEAEFRAAVSTIDPGAATEWVAPTERGRLRDYDALLIPGPVMAEEATARERFGAAAWSLVGVTHTLATHLVLRGLALLVTAPVRPWDAVICTSAAARSVVEHVLDAEEDRLAARLGATRFPRCLLPVIPLGVHTRDFAPDPGRRVLARRRLGLAADEVAAIFTGRLSFHAKAHPLAMYAGLEEAIRRTNRRIVLILSSWFANDAIGNAFRDGARRFAPNLRVIVSDGGEDETRRDVWAGADLFISLSDNIQETFGLTPVEAMAAGLPVVVSDWDGYRDTVRDGIDGFRIPTLMPAAPAGDDFAARYASGAFGYDMYCGAASLPVGMDHAVLADRLSALVADPDLRRRMGAAGLARARQVFDWTVVMAAIRETWAECRAVRLAQADGAPPPRPVPAERDPFAVFASFPTHLLAGDALVVAARLVARSDEILSHPLVGHLATCIPDSAPVVRALLAAVGGATGPLAIGEVAREAGLGVPQAVLVASVLAKLDVLRVQAAAPLPPAG